ncbi:hypothetical protein QUF74_05620 [Candidatus Halobeggiatoa sp. HSG11]|nr:hypothetical protein [Candidatus Halobeggiatoa sp. HSG11]
MKKLTITSIVLVTIMYQLIIAITLSLLPPLSIAFEEFEEFTIVEEIPTIEELGELPSLDEIIDQLENQYDGPTISQAPECGWEFVGTITVPTALCLFHGETGAPKFGKHYRLKNWCTGEYMVGRLIECLPEP